MTANSHNSKDYPKIIGQLEELRYHLSMDKPEHNQISKFIAKYSKHVEKYSKLTPTTHQDDNENSKMGY